MDHDDRLPKLMSKIIQWGRDRKIIQNSTALAQSRKTQEETHELIEAAAKIDVLREIHAEAVLQLAPAMATKVMQLIRREEENLIDAIGDVTVTLQMAAACAGLDYADCVEAAYREIAPRKGFLRKDGVFVKESAEGPQGAAQERTGASGDQKRSLCSEWSTFRKLVFRTTGMWGK